MYNTDSNIDGYRIRNTSGNRYGSEDIPYCLPSQDEDVFSFKQLQLHQHKKKNTKRQKQQMMRRPSMYEKIVSELAQNPNSDDLQLVGNSQDVDNNINSDNGLLQRNLSYPAERYTTYDRIVHELSTERSRSLDKSMSVIGGGYSDITTTNDDGTGLNFSDYGQLQNNEYAEASHESQVPPLCMPNFSTLGMLNKDENRNDAVNTELGAIDFYTSKEMKNDYNNMSKAKGQDLYDDLSLGHDNRRFSQTIDQNLLDRVSSLGIDTSSPPKDNYIMDDHSRTMNNYGLNSNVRLCEDGNQYSSSSWNNNENQLYSKSDDGLISTYVQENQTSNYISGPNSYFSSSDSRSKWGVTEAIKGAITGFFGEAVHKTSPERAQQVKEIADLNQIFRY